MYDVIVIGAGAAGLFCASEAGTRDRKVLVLDHASKIGEKIRISGGGRCNFTNIDTSAKNFLSQNPKFCISALSRFTPQDFIGRVEAAGIKWHEKKLGQLFCDESSTEIVEMLLDQCRRVDVEIRTGIEVLAVEKNSEDFSVMVEGAVIKARSLVIATGGKSIPKIGATGFGYDLAQQFGLSILDTRAGLVPLTFAGDIKEMARELAGVSVEASVGVGKTRFQEGFLFTHRGLSGPSILQISNYWRQGQPLSINLYPAENILHLLKTKKQNNSRLKIDAVLKSHLPKRLVQLLADYHGWNGKLAELSVEKLEAIAREIHQWDVIPAGSEGYRTAEVTLGGVDTAELNSKTMEVKSVKGLYFIGEVVDVTGWLGGYNFQWAWSSGYAAGQCV